MKDSREAHLAGWDFSGRSEFRSLFEPFTDAVFLVERGTGCVAEVNGSVCEWLDLSRAHLLSKSLDALLPPLAEPPWAQRIEDVLLSESVESSRSRFQGSGGDARSVEVTIRPARVGTDTYAVVVAREASGERRKEERRRLERHMREAQKLESLGMVAGGIAHDFNNLLSAILGNASLALEELPAGSLAFRSLEGIETAARRAADLASQMLAYSGKGHAVVEPIDLRDTVRDMAALLTVSISKKVDVAFDLNGDLPTIEADVTQVRQVIMNLITNASEAIGDTVGTISLSTDLAVLNGADTPQFLGDTELAAGEYVRLRVQDTGCGMDRDTLKRIFEPFFTTKLSGRGLGMASVLEIVRGHGGAVSVQSVLGQGTLFEIYFPISRTPLKRREGNRRSEAGDWRGSGTVLIVDDEETVLFVGKSLLERAGFEVLTARDGLEAVALLEMHVNEVSCVILDLTMPNMDGKETFGELRRVRADIPVVLSSGFGEEQVGGGASLEGLAGFLQKPYSGRELTEMMRRVLQ